MCHHEGKLVVVGKCGEGGAWGLSVGDKESGPQVGVFRGLELGVIRPFL